MQSVTPTESNVYRTKLDRSGRITLPQPVRDRLHLTLGDELLVIREGDGFRIETPEQALKAAQEYFCSLVPSEVSLVDELLAERQVEFEGEQTELRQYEAARNASEL